MGGGGPCGFPVFFVVHASEPSVLLWSGRVLDTIQTCALLPTLSPGSPSPSSWRLWHTPRTGSRTSSTSPTNRIKIQRRLCIFDDDGTTHPLVLPPRAQVVSSGSQGFSGRVPDRFSEVYRQIGSTGQLELPLGFFVSLCQLYPHSRGLRVGAGFLSNTYTLYPGEASEKVIGAPL